MARYIELDALVAEIDRRLEELYELLPDASKVENEAITIPEACNTGKYTALEFFRKYIDTLEVKDVDLDKEEERIWKDFNIGERHLSKNDLEKIAKHFFELGLKAQKGEEV